MIDLTRCHDDGRHIFESGLDRCRCGAKSWSDYSSFSRPAPVPGVLREETRDEAWWRRTFDEYQANSEAIIDDLRRQLLTLRGGVSSRVEPRWECGCEDGCAACKRIPSRVEPTEEAELPALLLWAANVLDSIGGPIRLARAEELNELRAHLLDARATLWAASHREPSEPPEWKRIATGLNEVINWALGEGGTFVELPEGRAPGDGKKPRIGRYYWRSELRSRRDEIVNQRSGFPHERKGT